MSGDRQSQRTAQLTAVLRRARLPESMAARLAMSSDAQVMAAIEAGRSQGNAQSAIEAEVLVALNDLTVALTVLGLPSDEIVQVYDAELHGVPPAPTHAESDTAAVVDDGDDLGAISYDWADQSTDDHAGGDEEVSEPVAVTALAEPVTSAAPRDLSFVPAPMSSSGVNRDTCDAVEPGKSAADQPTSPASAQPNPMVAAPALNGPLASGADGLLGWGASTQGSPHTSGGERTGREVPGATRSRNTLLVIASLGAATLVFVIVALTGGAPEPEHASQLTARAPTPVNTTVEALAERPVVDTPSPPPEKNPIDSAVIVPSAQAASRPPVPVEEPPVAAPAPSAPSVEPIELGDVPWKQEADDIVRKVTAGGGWSALWGTSADDAQRRLVGSLANATEQLDERPGVSRIEIHRQPRRNLTRPHIGLEFFNDRLYLIYLHYAKPRGFSASSIAAALTKAHGPSFGKWEEGPRRQCEGWRVTASAQVALCKLMSPSGKIVQELQLNVFDPSVYPGLRAERAAAFTGDNAIDGGAYVTSFRAYDAALKRFDAVLSDVSTFEAARAWRAITLLCQRKVGEARDAADTALSRAKSYSTQAFALWVMARIYVYDGRTDLALQSLDRAITLDPWNEDYATYAGELRTGKLSTLLCDKTAGWVEDEARDGNYDKAEICRLSGVPDPAWLDACSVERAMKEPDWDTKISDLVDKWRERRAGPGGR